MSIFSRSRVKALPEKDRWVLDTARGHPGGRGGAVLMRDAAITAPQSGPTAKYAEPAGTWPDNCTDLSRVAPIRGNVKVHTKEKYVVLAERNGWSVDRARGYVDGETCRQRARKPSKYALIGIDEYSLGFRAGYYERRNGSAVATDKVVSSPHTEHVSGVEISST